MSPIPWRWRGALGHWSGERRKVPVIERRPAKPGNTDPMARRTVQHASKAAPGQ
ncbi:MAG: hypothetical protein N838_09830 [Thiohalocapsa sp. PB-PSB1]|nr:MAG: hypothetical protein N838_09830 [Thiohalocapsa sp. PB-PSB1]